MRAHGRSTAGRRPAGDGAAADGRKLGLRGWLGLRDALLSAFGRVIAYARAQAAAAERDPTSAVHEFRKSVRRARAVVRVLMGALTAKGDVRCDGKVVGEERAGLAHRIAYVPQIAPRFAAPVRESSCGR